LYIAQKYMCVVGNESVKSLLFQYIVFRKHDKIKGLLYQYCHCSLFIVHVHGVRLRLWTATNIITVTVTILSHTAQNSLPAIDDHAITTVVTRIFIHIIT
jgi:hypothetical protein